MSLKFSNVVANSPFIIPSKSEQKHLKSIISVLLIISYYFLLIPFGQAQDQTEIDSLKQHLKRPLNDTSRIITLNELAWNLRRQEFDQAWKYAKEALNLSRELNYLPGLATSYNRLGLVEQYKKNLLLAISYYKKSLTIEEKIRHKYGIARAKNQIGNIYQTLNQVPEAIEYYQDALKIFNALDDSTKVDRAKISTCNNLGLCYRLIGDGERSLKYYLEGLALREKIGDQLGIANSYNRIGNFHCDVKNYQKALKYYKNSQSIYEKLSDDYELADVYHNIGVVYLELKNYSEALSHYQKSLEYYERTKRKELIPRILKNIGTTFLMRNEVSKALNYYQKSIDISIDKGDSSNLAVVYARIGEVMGIKQRNDLALDYFLKSLKTAINIKDKFIELEVLKNLAIFYAKEDRYKESHNYNVRYNELRDSLENGYKGAMNLKDAYEVAKQERELLEKNQEIERNQLVYESWRKTIFIYVLIFGIVLLTVVFLSILRAYKNRQKALLAEKQLNEKDQEIEDLLVGQELQTMGAMLEGQETERKRIAQDLHDRLGSLLAVIKLNFQAVDQQIDELKEQNKEQYLQAHKLLDQAADEVHKVAHNMISGVLRKFGLIPALEDMKKAIIKTNLLDINLVDVGFEDKRLEPSIEIAVYRIIQELVSNVLKHAEATNLEIQLYWKKEGLNIILEDNGKGFDIDTISEKSGMGLKNIQSRVERLEGELMIDSKVGKGTTTIIDIPL